VSAKRCDGQKPHPGRQGDRVKVEVSNYDTSRGRIIRGTMCHR
jgi:hypothetical protein